MNIVILGAGGFGREVRNLLGGFLPDTPHSFRGFLGDDTGVPGAEDISDQILGPPDAYEPEPSDRFVLAIGAMTARRRTVEALLAKGAQFLTLVHRLALVADSAELGHGVLVYPFATVSNNAKLANFAKLNYYASVGHDTQVGEYGLLAPYATVNGFGILEPDVYLSTHATVAPQVRVGSNSVVSANSAVMKSVKANSFVFGVPGRVMARMT